MRYLKPTLKESLSGIRLVDYMFGVVLDADSLGKDIDLTPVTQLLDDW